MGWVDNAIDSDAPRPRIERATAIKTTTQRPSDPASRGRATGLVVCIAIGQRTKARRVGRRGGGGAVSAIAMTRVEGMRWDESRG